VGVISPAVVRRLIVQMSRSVLNSARGKLAVPLAKTGYGQYLLQLLQERVRLT
jgi:hypothetical protein